MYNTITDFSENWPWPYKLTVTLLAVRIDPYLFVRRAHAVRIDTASIHTAHCTNRHFEFHYADFPMTCHGKVLGKLATCHGEVADIDHITGKFWGFRPSWHVELVWKNSRWFEKIQWQVGNKPVCVVLMEFGNEHYTTNGLSHVTAHQAMWRPITH